MVDLRIRLSLCRAHSLAFIPLNYSALLKLLTDTQRESVYPDKTKKPEGKILREIHRYGLVVASVALAISARPQGLPQFIAEGVGDAC